MSGAVAAPAKPAPDAPVLTVAGRVYAGWTRLRVTRAIDRLVSDFDIELSERWAGQSQPWQIAPFTPCTVSLGKDLVLTGYVDDFHCQIDARSHVVRVTGRSKTQDIVDCTPDLPGGQFVGYTLDKIATAIASLYGIGVVVQAPMGDAFPDATIQRHETGFQFLERLARLRAVLLCDDEQGRLVLTQAGATRAHDALAAGRNIERATAHLSGAHRFSVYTVKTQIGVQAPLPLTPIDAAPAGHDLTAPPSETAAAQIAAADAAASGEDVPQTQANTVTAATATDPGVPRFRPHTIIAESGLNAAQAQARADWQARYNAGRGTHAEIEVSPWRQSDGSLWRLNTVVSITAPQLQLDTDLLIAGVSHTLDGARGRLTLLTLGPVAAYTPDPGQVRVRKGKGGGGAVWNVVPNP